MTVSNVINGRFDSMRKETRRRVEKAIEALSYRPMSTGRSLRLDRHFTVGMVIVDSAAGFLADPFISQVVAGLTNRIAEDGYGCLLHGVTPARFEESIFLRFSRTDGLCVFLCGEDEQRRQMQNRLLRLKEPIVFIEDVPQSDGGDFAVVRLDDRGSAAELTGMLLDRGAKSFVILVPEARWPAVYQRIEGIESALAAHNVGSKAQVVKCGEGNIWEVKTALEKHLDTVGRPDAVIAAADRSGIATLQVVSERGIRLPEDMLVGTFNGVDFLRPNDRPAGVIRVVSSAYELGRQSARTLIDRLSGDRFSQPVVTLPVEIQG